MIDESHGTLPGLVQRSSVLRAHLGTLREKANRLDADTMFYDALALMDRFGLVSGDANAQSIDTMAKDADTLDFDTAAALEAIGAERLDAMARAGETVRESYRLLGKAKQNVVGQCLAHHGTFYQLDHYPPGDVYDEEHHSQYYYHAHRPESGEHGHFHTFLRAGGMPAGIRPGPYSGKAFRPTGKDALTHFVAISMNKPGLPIALFTTNRWVTDETFYAAGDVIAMLDRFRIDHTYPCLAVNRWISAMMVLFRPQIEALLIERDRVIEAWRNEHPDGDVYEDRQLEITSIIDIDVERQIAMVDRSARR